MPAALRWSMTLSPSCVILCFCTSGSSPISGSIDELHAAAPEAERDGGRRFASNASQQEIDAWVEEVR